MCEPISLTMLAVGVAASGAYSAKTASDAETKYQKKVGEATNTRITQNRALAWQDYKNKLIQEQTGIDQARAKQAFQIQDLNTAGLKARSAAAVSAAEGGVGGNSLGVLLQDYSSQNARGRVKSTLNQTFIEQKAESNIRSYGTEYVGRATSIQPFMPSPVKQPNYIGFGLQALGGGMSAFSGAMNSPNPGPKVDWETTPSNPYEYEFR